MLLSDAAIRNRTTVFVLILLIVLLGAASYATLPREAEPDVPIPLVLVTTAYEGVAPEDIESSLTKKIEKELTALKGLKELRSTSAEGLSLIVAEFLPDVRIADALDDVRAKVDVAKAELPTDAEEPVITEINVAEFPIMMINVSGTISPVRLKAIADRLEDAIEEIPGVLGVDVIGALEREIRLEIDPDRVTAYGLTVSELMALIPSENVNVSAGGLATRGVKFNVRVPAEFVKPEEVDRLLLATRDGRGIYLTDVAKVADTFKDPASYARMDGVESITVAVRKRIGADIVPIARRVVKILEYARRHAPAGVEFKIVLDKSKDIRLMVADLENNIVSGLLLVLIVLVLFLGLRTSIIVAAAIPMSMLISFALIAALGYTLNMIVLFSLILALGMLVDNAIVIVENTYRHMQMGYSPVTAAMKGTAEVAWPVTTSTATTVAAFSPMLFWPGIMGDFMKYLPITLIITLCSSLFVALVISPTICSVVARGKVKRADGQSWFVRGYTRLLHAALSHSAVTLAAAFLLLAGVVALYAAYGKGKEFVPDIDPRRAIINIRCPQGTDLDRTDRIARLVERRLEPYRDQLEHLAVNVGSSGSAAEMSFGGSSSGPHVANLTLMFPDYEVRRRTGRPSAEAVAAIRRDLTGIPGAEIKVEPEQHGPPTGEAITVRFIGEDFATLEEISERGRGLIADVPGLVNLRSDYEAARPELVFHVDRRRAALLGVNTLVVGKFLQTAVFGSNVGTYRQFNDEYDITVRLPISQRVHIEDLLRLRVPNAGAAVPLSSLGRFEYAGGFGTINRINQKRVVTLTGGAEGRRDEQVLADVQQRLAGLPLPAGYVIRYAGQKEEQDKASAFLIKAFFVAVLLIVMILVTQFNTLSVPLIIMTTVGLSLIGVLAGLLICQMPFGIIMTGIGVISLAGVVVNNAIVLLDYTRRLQRRGMDVIAAAVQAGATRLRPVLLTAATTILGLIPMATGVSLDVHKIDLANPMNMIQTGSESSEWWASMAIAVIFGLAFATLLTLVFVPTLYVLLYRAAAAMGLGGLRRVAEKPARETPEAEDF